MDSNTNIVWNSRLLDVHLVSDHPSFASIYEDILFRYPSLDIFINTPSKGKRAKGDSRKIFKALLLDLYVSWCEDPNQWLGISTNNNSWNTGSRYNTLFISRNIKALLATLVKLDLLDRLNHRHSSINPQFNHTARYQASETLRGLFYLHHFGTAQISKNPDREVIILRNSEVDEFGESLGSSAPIEYAETADTEAMRLHVRAYNELLAKHHIDLGSAESPIVKITFWDKRLKRVQEQNIVIGQHNKFVYRVFSRGSFDCHGRFYGGWWTRIPSEMRKDIFIDGRPTLEVDFKSMHVHLLSAKCRALLPPDPYRLKELVIEEISEEEQRAWMKALILHSLNAKSKKEAFKAFRYDAEFGNPMRNATDVQLEGLLCEFVNCYPHLEQYLCSDQGIYLMRQDSDIAAEVIRLMTRQGIPVLCIHDSFIVDAFHWIELREAMTLAAMRIAGRDLLAEQGAFECERQRGYADYAVKALRSVRNSLECFQSARRRTQLFGITRPSSGFMTKSAKSWSQ